MSSINYFEPEVYLSEAEIKTQVAVLAQAINADYGDQEITAICTLKGGIVFFADLLRQLKMPVVCEFLGVSSYGMNSASTGEVRLTLDVSESLAGKHVLLVEDIADSGLTLHYLQENLALRKPASLKTVALLFKPEALKVPHLKLDYVGFRIPNDFVVGYGLDYAEKFRGLPYIGKITL